MKDMSFDIYCSFNNELVIYAGFPSRGARWAPFCTTFVDSEENSYKTKNRHKHKLFVFEYAPHRNKQTALQKVYTSIKISWMGSVQRMFPIGY